MSHLHIQLLGDFRLVYDNVAVTTVNTPRLQALLAYLLLHRHTPQSRRHLAFLFWPDSTEGQARTNLRHLLHDLHRALPNAAHYLLADSQTVWWQLVAPGMFDVADFEAAIAEDGRAGLERAAALYRGDLLPSCYDDWIQPARERLRHACTGALERLVDLTEAQHAYGAAITHAEQLLQQNPDHEATYRSLMRLHTLNGDRAAALHVYHTCATVLRRELGVPPDAATRALHERLLNVEAPIAAPIQRATVTEFPLVGRVAEWMQLRAVWRDAAAGRPQMALIAGEAGIGKTRLAEELAAWVVRQGVNAAAVAASARSYAAEGSLPYAPVAAWLRAHSLPSLDPVWLTELARLLPELLVAHPALPPPAPLSQAWQRNRLFEALARALLCDPRARLLVLDDLHWCDCDTLEWLHYLLRFDRRGALLVVGTLRSSEADSPELAALLAALRRDGQITEIELGPLNTDETATLAAYVTGCPLDPGLTLPLFQGSEGNPLFVVEMVQAGLAQGDARDPVAGAATYPHDMVHQPLPAKVRQVLERRLAQLSPASRELAGLAATIGRQFGFGVLSAAADLADEALVRSLDELWQRRIIREQGDGAYDFSHNKIRETAYARLSMARRRLLHCRVAQALETIYAAALDTVSGQIGRHYELAGLIEPAVVYYRRAAEASQQVYANEDAIQYYRRALELLGDPNPSNREMAAILWERIGDILHLAAQYEPARAAYRQAATFVLAPDRVALARLHRKMGNVWREERVYATAQQIYREAERILGAPPIAGVTFPGSTETISRWWQEWIQLQFEEVQTQYWLAESEVAVAQLGRMRAAIEQYGCPQQRVHFFMQLALIQWQRERFSPTEQTLACLQAAQAAVRTSIEAQNTPHTVFQLGFLSLWHDQLAEAEENFESAQAMVERGSDVTLKIRCLIYMSLVYRKQGRLEDVRAYTDRALALASFADMPEYMATARANQAWLAWRGGDMDGVDVHGRAALGLWAQFSPGHPSTPFQWTALWPLLDMELRRDGIARALDYTHALLLPTQQRLSTALADLLGHAVHAQESSDLLQARYWLDQAITMAKDRRYL